MEPWTFPLLHVVAWRRSSARRLAERLSDGSRRGSSRSGERRIKQSAAFGKLVQRRLQFAQVVARDAARRLSRRDDPLGRKRARLARFRRLRPQFLVSEQRRQQAEQLAATLRLVDRRAPRLDLLG